MAERAVKAGVENGIWISDGGEWECDSISATLLGDNSTLTDSGSTREYSLGFG